MPTSFAGPFVGVIVPLLELDPFLGCPWAVECAPSALVRNLPHCRQEIEFELVECVDSAVLTERVAAGAAATDCSLMVKLHALQRGILGALGAARGSVTASEGPLRGVHPEDVHVLDCDAFTFTLELPGHALGVPSSKATSPGTSMLYSQQRCFTMSAICCRNVSASVCSLSSCSKDVTCSSASSSAYHTADVQLSCTRSLLNISGDGLVVDLRLDVG